MILTNENYFSREADREYLSVSQYHHFLGTEAFRGCEAMAMALISGEWEKEVTTAMLVGSYVDAYFEGTLDKFRQETPQIFTQKGELLAPFKQALEIIAFAEKDELLMSYLKGEGLAQVIVTGKIGGVLWKGKLDRLHKGLAIVDGKVVASIRDKVWCEMKGKLNFIEAYGYINQGAVYRELWYQMSGEKLPFFIAALSKEKVPDKEIIQIPDSTMDNALDEIKDNVPRIMNVKSGKLPAIRCGICDYCKSTKILTDVISLYDL